MLKPQKWLLPVSIIYQAAIQLRNRFYDRDVFSSVDVGVPVISVGNISAGGTGKTPFVIYLANRIRSLAQDKRFPLAIISRGYGGRNKGTAVVCDGKRMVFGPEVAGDEPVMMAQALPRTIVIADKDRARAARFAIEEYGAKLILLDDGFQHRRIRRTLDIVLLNADDPFGNNRVIPAGYLREPPSAITRADLVVLSKTEAEDSMINDRVDKISRLISKPVIATRLMPKVWYHLNGSELHSAEMVAGKRVIAFAGIANPDSFFETVSSLGGDIVGEIPLADHHPYTRRTINRISNAFVRNRADWLVTTAKDAVKLPPLFRLLPVYYLQTEFEVIVGSELLDSSLQKILSTTQKSSR